MSRATVLIRVVDHAYVIYNRCSVHLKSQLRKEDGVVSTFLVLIEHPDSE